MIRGIKHADKRDKEQIIYIIITMGSGYLTRYLRTKYGVLYSVLNGCNLNAVA